MQAFEELEQRFGDLIGNPNCVACATGSAALLLACEALRLPANSYVVVPEYTMVACARAVALADLNPVFVDCDDTLLLNAAGGINLAMRNPFARAAMPVHIYGRRCDMNAIHALVSPRGVRIIEDMSEAHGIKPHPESFAACWSFYKNKIIAGEEGGLVAFKNPADADYARQIRCMGFTPEHNFEHVPRGWNHRLSNTHAKIILDSLSRLDENLESRRRVEHWYDELMPKEFQMPLRDAPWVYDVRLQRDDQMDAVVQELNAQGIMARHGFKPMSMQREFRWASYKSLSAYWHSLRVMYLPIHPDMELADVLRIVSAFKTAVSRPAVAAAPGLSNNAPVG